MDNEIVYFEYEGITTTIYCTGKEKMEEIVQKFCTKVRIDKNSIYCLYSGNILNENITLENLKKSKGHVNKIVILVTPKYKTGFLNNNIELNKSPQIICPECKEIASIKVKNYKISIKCKNNHIIKNKFIKDFLDTQLIDESKITCEICKIKNIKNSYNKEFFFCFNCKKNICPLCKSNHDQNHNVITYGQKNFICPEHEDYYFLYCKTCKKNLCMGCENNHCECETIYLGKLIPNKNDMEKKCNELKENFNKLKDEIKKINDILNIFLENMNIYYDINNDINKSFDIKLKNFETLNNLKEINNKEILNDINRIINEENIFNKFKYIFDIYTLMNTKDTNNYFEDDENNQRNKYKYDSKPNKNFEIDEGINKKMDIYPSEIPSKDNDLTSIYKQKIISMNKPNNIPIGIDYYSLSFQTALGKTTFLYVHPDISVGELLKKYYKEFYKENAKENDIAFIYNSTLLKSEDETPIKKVFAYSKFISILVLNKKELVGTQFMKNNK